MESLKKELEEELKLSTEDPRSHAWYHGQLSREVLNRPYYSHCFTHNETISIHKSKEYTDLWLVNVRICHMRTLLLLYPLCDQLVLE